MARQIDRKELKNPDQFVTFWSRVGASVAERSGLVVGIVVAALVATVGGWGVYSFLGKREAAASAAFARIEKVASAQLLPESGEAKFDDDLPHFKTEKERLEAAVKEADGFLGAYSGSKLRDEALLLKARYLLMLERAPEAAGIYQELLGGAVDKRLRFLAREGLGYALEAQGQLDGAIAAFATAAEEAEAAGGFYRDRALFQRARLLEKKGSAAEAEKVFREILEKVPATALRDEINDRLAAIEKK